MKIAVSGKGGVGKTSIVSWLGDYLARRGKNVWMVDADTALSLGQASGLARSAIPQALILQEELLQQKIHPDGSNMMHLNPDVGDLPESLYVPLPVVGPPFSGIKPGEKRLLVMGSLSNAGAGCACGSNALLKSLLAHLVFDREEWVLLDMEAGVEHLGRGTISHVDHLLVISEPSMRSLETAVEVSRMGKELGLTRQTLILNQATQSVLADVPFLSDLPKQQLTLPTFPCLKNRQLHSSSVLGLDPTSMQTIDDFCQKLIQD